MVMLNLSLIISAAIILTVICYIISHGGEE
jgi:hypothetical protein